MRALRTQLNRPGLHVLAYWVTTSGVAGFWTVVGCLCFGRGVILQSSLADLGAPGGSRLRIRTPKPAQLGDALAVEGIATTVVAPDQIEVVGATGERVGTLAAEHGIPIFETTAHTPDLEDVFVQLIDASREEVAP